MISIYIAEHTPLELFFPVSDPVSYSVIWCDVRSNGKCCIVGRTSWTPRSISQPRTYKAQRAASNWAYNQ